jgi:transcriptional regulator with XRE-family HTH domain
MSNGKLFSQIRLASGLSMRALAKEAGVSVKAVWCLENGRGKASPLTLGKIATALGYGLEELEALLEKPAESSPVKSERPGPGPVPIPVPVDYVSVGQALNVRYQIQDSAVAVAERVAAPEVVVVVPMTVEELITWQDRIKSNEKRIEKLSAILSAAGLMAAFIISLFQDHFLNSAELAVLVLAGF